MILSIIITHYKTPELLHLCIDSIKKTIKNIDYEIIIVDSGTEKKTEYLIKEKCFKIQFISFKNNVGYAKAVNEGIRQAKGDYILILNADIIVLDNAIYKMLEFMEKNSDIGILAPQLLDFTNNIQISCFSKPTIKAILARRTFLGKTKWGQKSLDKFTISDWDRKLIREVDWVQGSAIIARKEAIEKVGLLDERFFMYLEDADWCRRFWDNGYKVIYYPQAKMAHYYHRSSKKWGVILDPIFNKYTRTHIFSALKYFWKYHAK